MGLSWFTKEAELKIIFPKEILLCVIRNVGYDNDLNYSDNIALPLLLTIACTNKFLNMYINTDVTFNKFFADKHGTNIQFYKEAVLQAAEHIITTFEPRQAFMPTFFLTIRHVINFDIDPKHVNIYNYFDLIQEHFTPLNLVNSKVTIRYNQGKWNISIFWEHETNAYNSFLKGDCKYYFKNFPVPLARILCANLPIESNKSSIQFNN